MKKKIKEKEPSSVTSQEAIQNHAIAKLNLLWAAFRYSTK